MAVERKKYRLEELEIDVSKRSIRRDGQAVHLSNRPFQVLLYLIENRERLVSRQELLDLFWEGSDVYDVNLTKCVGAIRKALNENTDNPRFIETRWAEGYRYIGLLEEITEDSSNFAGVEERNTDSDNGSELKPDETSTIKPQTQTETWKSRKFVITAVAILIVACGVPLTVYLSRYWTKKQKVAINSIAVLPLKNLTADPNNEYLSDGITESLITALSKVDGVKVISLGSVLHFKGNNANPREVGRQLNVAAVLEGSVRKNGESVQVSVRLVSAEDGSVLWAGETYDRALKDILILQNEIAHSVALELRARLTGENEKRLARRYTENAEAYELYLKGRYFWNKRNPESLKKSLEFFEQAVKVDPNYALAYTGLADCYQLFAEYRHLPVTEGFAKARTYATKALEIDESLAEAHTSLAYTLAFYDWNWTGAEKEFKRAIELNPNYATAHQWYSEYLCVVGRFDEAHEEIKRAQELDPLSLIIRADFAAYYYLTKQYDKTIEEAKKILELEPKFYWAYMFLWAAYEQKNMHAEATSSYARGIVLFGQISESEEKEMNRIYEKQGLKAFWEKRLEQIKAASSKNIFLAWDWAFCYMRLKDKERAIEWLEKAFTARDRWIINSKDDPQYDFLRDDARFQELIKRLGLGD